jgi:hypothetical protein
MSWTFGAGICVKVQDSSKRLVVSKIQYMYNDLVSKLTSWWLCHMLGFEAFSLYTQDGARNLNDWRLTTWSFGWTMATLLHKFQYHTLLQSCRWTALSVKWPEPWRWWQFTFRQIHKQTKLLIVMLPNLESWNEKLDYYLYFLWFFVTTIIYDSRKHFGNESMWLLYIVRTVCILFGLIMRSCRWVLTFLEY